MLWNGGGYWLRLGLRHPATPKVIRYGCDLAGTGWCGRAKATSLSDLDSRTASSYYHGSASKKLYIKVVTEEDNNWEAIEFQPALRP